MAESKFEYEILSITVTNFAIELKDEYLKVVKKNPAFHEYTLEINSDIRGLLKNNIIIVQMQVKVFLDKGKNIQLGSIIVNNNFKLKDINQYYNKKNDSLNLPKDIQATLVTTSICHTRAIFITKCAGTFLSNALIPIINLNN